MSRKSVALLTVVVCVLACRKPEQAPTQTQTTETAPSATTATTATVPTAEHEYKLDHFKFWKVERSAYKETLELFGQCDRQPWKATIDRIESIGNPVDKRHNDKHIGIHGKLHYLAYIISGSEAQPKRKAVLSNQFTNGQAAWLLGAPEVLLVPAGKAIDGQPEMQKGDHFVCYQVLEAKPMDVNVSLEDQFDIPRHKREEIKQLTPKYFCVPVEKRRQEKPPSVPEDKETHLAIYQFTPERLEKPLTVNTVDQFKRNKLNVIQSQWLAVPSTKYGKPEELK